MLRDFIDPFRAVSLSGGFTNKCICHAKIPAAAEPDATKRNLHQRSVFQAVGLGMGVQGSGCLEALSCTPEDSTLPQFTTTPHIAHGQDEESWAVAFGHLARDSGGCERIVRNRIIVEWPCIQPGGLRVDFN